MKVIIGLMIFAGFWVLQFPAKNAIAGLLRQMRRRALAVTNGSSTESPVYIAGLRELFVCH
jgi:hypothetical protein